MRFLAVESEKPTFFLSAEGVSGPSGALPCICLYCFPPTKKSFEGEGE